MFSPSSQFPTPDSLSSNTNSNLRGEIDLAVAFFEADSTLEGSDVKTKLVRALTSVAGIRNMLDYTSNNTKNPFSILDMILIGATPSDFSKAGYTHEDVFSYISTLSTDSPSFIGEADATQIAQIQSTYLNTNNIRKPDVDGVPQFGNAFELGLTPASKSDTDIKAELKSLIKSALIGTNNTQEMLSNLNILVPNNQSVSNLTGVESATNTKYITLADLVTFAINYYDNNDGETSNLLGADAFSGTSIQQLRNPGGAPINRLKTVFGKTDITKYIEAKFSNTQLKTAGFTDAEINAAKYDGADGFITKFKGGEIVPTFQASGLYDGIKLLLDTNQLKSTAKYPTDSSFITSYILPAMAEAAAVYDENNGETISRATMPIASDGTLKWSTTNGTALNTLKRSTLLRVLYALPDDSGKRHYISDLPSKSLEITLDDIYNAFSADEIAASDFTTTQLNTMGIPYLKARSNDYTTDEVVKGYPTANKWAVDTKNGLDLTSTYAKDASNFFEMYNFIDSNNEDTSSTLYDVLQTYIQAATTAYAAFVKPASLVTMTTTNLDGARGVFVLPDESSDDVKATLKKSLVLQWYAANGLVSGSFSSVLDQLFNVIENDSDSDKAVNLFRTAFSDDDLFDVNGVSPKDAETEFGASVYQVMKLNFSSDADLKTYVKNMVDDNSTDDEVFNSIVCLGTFAGEFNTKSSKKENGLKGLKNLLNRNLTESASSFDISKTTDEAFLANESGRAIQTLARFVESADNTYTYRYEKKATQLAVASAAAVAATATTPAVPAVAAVPAAYSGYKLSKKLKTPQTSVWSDASPCDQTKINTIHAVFAVLAYFKQQGDRVAGEQTPPEPVASTISELNTFGVIYDDITNTFHRDVVCAPTSGFTFEELNDIYKDLKPADLYYAGQSRYKVIDYYKAKYISAHPNAISDPTKNSEFSDDLWEAIFNYGEFASILTRGRQGHILSRLRKMVDQLESTDPDHPTHPAYLQAMLSYVSQSLANWCVSQSKTVTASIAPAVQAVQAVAASAGVQAVEAVAAVGPYIKFTPAEAINDTDKRQIFLAAVMQKLIDDKFAVFSTRWTEKLSKEPENYGTPFTINLLLKTIVKARYDNKPLQNILGAANSLSDEPYLKSVITKCFSKSELAKYLENFNSSDASTYGITVRDAAAAGVPAETIDEVFGYGSSFVYGDNPKNLELLHANDLIPAITSVLQGNGTGAVDDDSSYAFLSAVADTVNSYFPKSDFIAKQQQLITGALGSASLPSGSKPYLKAVTQQGNPSQASTVVAEVKGNHGVAITPASGSPAIEGKPSKMEFQVVYQDNAGVEKSTYFDSAGKVQKTPTVDSDNLLTVAAALYAITTIEKTSDSTTSPTLKSLDVSNGALALMGASVTHSKELSGFTVNEAAAVDPTLSAFVAGEDDDCFPSGILANCEWGDVEIAGASTTVPLAAGVTDSVIEANVALARGSLSKLTSAKILADKRPLQSLEKLVPVPALMQDLSGLQSQITIKFSNKETTLQNVSSVQFSENVQRALDALKVNNKALLQRITSAITATQYSGLDDMELTYYGSEKGFALTKPDSNNYRDDVVTDSADHDAFKKLGAALIAIVSGVTVGAASESEHGSTLAEALAPLFTTAQIQQKGNFSTLANLESFVSTNAAELFGDNELTAEDALKAGWTANDCQSADYSLSDLKNQISPLDAITGTKHPASGDTPPAATADDVKLVLAEKGYSITDILNAYTSDDDKAKIAQTVKSLMDAAPTKCIKNELVEFLIAQLTSSQYSTVFKLAPDVIASATGLTNTVKLSAMGITRTDINPAQRIVDLLSKTSLSHQDIQNILISLKLSGGQYPDQECTLVDLLTATVSVNGLYNGVAVPQDRQVWNTDESRNTLINEYIAAKYPNKTSAINSADAKAKITKVASALDDYAIKEAIDELIAYIEA